MGTHEIIRISEFGMILFRAENYLNISSNLKHWEWLYIGSIKLVIWSLNSLGVKSTYMGDFPKLGHISGYTCKF